MFPHMYKVRPPKGSNLPEPSAGSEGSGGESQWQGNSWRRPNRWEQSASPQPTPPEPTSRTSTKPQANSLQELPVKSTMPVCAGDGDTLTGSNNPTPWRRSSHSRNEAPAAAQQPQHKSTLTWTPAQPSTDGKQQQQQTGKNPPPAMSASVLKKRNPDPTHTLPDDRVSRFGQNRKGQEDAQDTAQQPKRIRTLKLQTDPPNDSRSTDDNAKTRQEGQSVGQPRRKLGNEEVDTTKQPGVDTTSRQNRFQRENSRDEERFKQERERREELRNKRDELRRKEQIERERRGDLQKKELEKEKERTVRKEPTNRNPVETMLQKHEREREELQRLQDERAKYEEQNKRETERGRNRELSQKQGEKERNERINQPRKNELFEKSEKFGPNNQQKQRTSLNEGLSPRKSTTEEPKEKPKEMSSENKAIPAWRRTSRPESEANLRKASKEEPEKPQKKMSGQDSGDALRKTSNPPQAEKIQLKKPSLNQEPEGPLKKNNRQDNEQTMRKSSNQEPESGLRKGNTQEMLRKTSANQEPEGRKDSRQGMLKKTSANQEPEGGLRKDSRQEMLRKTSANQEPEGGLRKDSRQDMLRKTSANQEPEGRKDSRQEMLRKTSANQEPEGGLRKDSRHEMLRKTSANKEPEGALKINSSKDNEQPTRRTSNQEPEGVLKKEGRQGMLRKTGTSQEPEGLQKRISREESELDEPGGLNERVSVFGVQLRPRKQSNTAAANKEPVVLRNDDEAEFDKNTLVNLKNKWETKIQNEIGEKEKRRSVTQKPDKVESEPVKPNTTDSDKKPQSEKGTKDDAGKERKISEKNPGKGSNSGDKEEQKVEAPQMKKFSLPSRKDSIKSNPDEEQPKKAPGTFFHDVKLKKAQANTEKPKPETKSFLEEVKLKKIEPNPRRTSRVNAGLLEAFEEQNDGKEESDTDSESGESEEESDEDETSEEESEEEEDEEEEEDDDDEEEEEAEKAKVDNKAKKTEPQKQATQQSNDTKAKPKQQPPPPPPQPASKQKGQGSGPPPPPPIPGPPPPPPPQPGMKLKKPISAAKKQKLDQLKKAARQRADWNTLLRDIEGGIKLRRLPSCDKMDRSNPMLPNSRGKGGKFVYESEKPISHNQLLHEIHRGVKLRKVKTNDRSKPCFKALGVKKLRRQFTMENINKLESMPSSSDEEEDIDKMRDDLQATKGQLEDEIKNRKKLESENKINKIDIDALQAEVRKLRRQLKMAGITDPKPMTNGEADEIVPKLEKSMSKLRMHEAEPLDFNELDTLETEINNLKTQVESYKKQADDYTSRYNEVTQKLLVSENSATEWELRSNYYEKKFKALQKDQGIELPEIEMVGVQTDPVDIATSIPTSPSEERKPFPMPSKSGSRRNFAASIHKMESFVEEEEDDDEEEEEEEEEEEDESEDESEESDSEEEDEEKAAEKRAESAARRRERDTKLLMNKLNNLKTKEQRIKDERKTFKDNIKKCYGEMKIEREQYFKTKKELDEMAKAFQTSDNEEEDSSEDDESDEDEEEEIPREREEGEEWWLDDTTKKPIKLKKKKKKKANSDGDEEPNEDNLPDLETPTWSESEQEASEAEEEPSDPDKRLERLRERTKRHEQRLTGLRKNTNQLKTQLTRSEEMLATEKRRHQRLDEELHMMLTELA